MIKFRVEAEGENYCALICVTSEREWTILAGIRRGEDLYERVLSYCHCAVAGMDIAKPQSRSFQLIGLGGFVAAVAG